MVWQALASPLPAFMRTFANDLASLPAFSVLHVALAVSIIGMPLLLLFAPVGGRSG